MYEDTRLLSRLRFADEHQELDYGSVACGAGHVLGLV